MGNISKHQSTIKRLIRINAEKNPTKFVSVVYMDENGEIEIPKLPTNPNGVLVVPKPMSIEDWVKAGIQEDKD